MWRVSVKEWINLSEERTIKKIYYPNREKIIKRVTYFAILICALGCLIIFIAPREEISTTDITYITLQPFASIAGGLVLLGIVIILINLLVACLIKTELVVENK